MPDWRLCRSLPGHDCNSVRRMGWNGLRNGDLLTRAEREFDVFITGDRNLAFQQEMTKYDLAVLVLHTSSIQLSDTRPLMPKVLTILSTVKAGTVTDIYA